MSQPFFHGAPGIAVGFAGAPRFAFLGALTGADEDSVTGTDTASAVALIDRLLLAGPPPCVAPGEAATLSAGQRDRILAALHERIFGPRIVATLRCRACGEQFDVAFMLPDLCAHVWSGATAEVQVQPDGFLQHAGLRFRLPDALDEHAIAALPSDAARTVLLQRCAGPGVGFEALEQAMTLVDPLLDLDLPANCVECGAPQAMRFAIQRWFLGSVTAEHRRLVEEVHALAAAYGWSRTEILGLRCASRREHVELLAIAARRRAA
jgi:hypothetical protein